jgi:excisionase family DNA binding protein
MQFLTPKAVCKLTSLSRSTLDRLVAANKFPQPIPLTERRMAFRDDQVAEWMEGRLSVPYNPARMARGAAKPKPSPFEGTVPPPKNKETRVFR